MVRKWALPVVFIAIIITALSCGPDEPPIRSQSSPKAVPAPASVPVSSPKLTPIPTPATKLATTPTPTLTPVSPLPSSPKPALPVQYRLSKGSAPYDAGDITFDPPGGIYSPGTTVNLIATPKTGCYKFSSWGGEAYGKSPTTSVTMNRDMSVIANFTPVRYRLNKDVVPPQGAGNIKVYPSGDTFDCGTEIQLTAEPTSCYKFVTWGGTFSDTNPTIKLKMNREVNIIASFTCIQYTLSISVASGEGTIARIPAVDKYCCGTEVRLIAQPVAGFRLWSWGGDASGTNSEIIIIMNSNKNVTATFR